MFWKDVSRTLAVPRDGTTWKSEDRRATETFDGKNTSATEALGVNCEDVPSESSWVSAQRKCLDADKDDLFVSKTRRSRVGVRLPRTASV